MHPLVLTLMISFLPTKTETGKCFVNFNTKMDECTHVTNERHVTWETISLCQNLSVNNGTDSCKIKSSCAKNFRLTIFDQLLFALTMKNTFIGMLIRCCNKCAACSVGNVVKDNTLVTESILNSSDLVFPVLAKDPALQMHGFYFLTAYDAPTAYYFSFKKSEERILREVVDAYVNLWPFLLICLLFAFISGFMVWLIEARKNPDEFSSHFCPGMFDGFWWSFIAMTTVGFGDKVTKTYVGRIFALFWVLFGITTFSMLTATATTEIISARSPANTDMAGKDIAVLKGRIHDMSVVAHHGGILRVGSIGHTMRGIDELVSMVENRTVHGYLIDRNTFNYFNSRLTEGKYKHIGERIKRLGIIKTEKPHGTSPLKCGILIKDFQDFEFFSSYFDNNRLAMHSCNDMRMNTRSKVEANHNDLLSVDSKIFETVIVHTMIIVAVILTIGILVEGIRYYMKKKRLVSSDNTA